MQMGMYDDNYFVVSADKNVLFALSLQYEVRGNLTKSKAWDTAMQYAPKDGVKQRSFTNSIGTEVTVFRSESLAENLSDADWYECHPVGTYQVALDKTNDGLYFSAMVSAGVELDDNDPEAIDDC